MVCYGNGWWCPKGCLMFRIRFIVWWRNLSAHKRITHWLTLMTFLSIVVPNKVGQMLQITSSICDQCSSACALITCTPTRLNAFLVQKRFPFIGCFIGKRGPRADTAKVKAIVDWRIPLNQKEFRKWLGLANFLHKYSEKLRWYGSAIKWSP